MFCECVCFFFSSECSSLSHTRAYPTHLYLEQCFEGNGVEKIAIIQPLRPDIRPMITFSHKTIFPKSRVVQRCFCLHTSFIGASNQNCSFVPVCQNGERCRISPPHGSRWSCGGWRSSPTTAYRCWPTPRLEMESAAMSCTSKPARIVSTHGVDRAEQRGW